VRDMKKIRKPPVTTQKNEAKVRNRGKREIRRKKKEPEDRRGP